ncbi:5'-methylthioadenosine/adenosylhomocysteine nucleosidase [Bernardetia sp.]|uniref:5'-methylthioadenosine/adenosylhomocysteine nucleosidase n=1 Tax=Bernardetia sp. TaxID=1937974 RepID=UPI0025C07A28|nr:5'-methylthioadenosine/adenosylhomocysteine nucleosidase [Bernardetia sp.]
MNKLSQIAFVFLCSFFSLICFFGVAQTASDIEKNADEGKKNELSARQRQELKNPNRKPFTAVIGAMQVEVDLFKLKVHPKRDTVIMGVTFTVGKMRTRDVVVVKSGIGKVNSAMTAALLLEHFNPTEVIFTGIAGGIDAELLPGDIVVGERAAQHDFGQLTTEGITVWKTFDYDETSNPLFFPCDSLLIAKTQEAGDKARIKFIRTYDAKRKPTINTGTIVTGDVFVASTQFKNRLEKEFEAKAVEMEGGAVAQVCYQQGVPFVIIRSISDTADENAAKLYKKFLKVASFNAAHLVSELIFLLEKENKKINKTE